MQGVTVCTITHNYTHCSIYYSFFFDECIQIPLAGMSKISVYAFVCLHKCEWCVDTKHSLSPSF